MLWHGIGFGVNGAGLFDLAGPSVAIFVAVVKVAVVDMAAVRWQGLNDWAANGGEVGDSCRFRWMREWAGGVGEGDDEQIWERMAGIVKKAGQGHEAEGMGEDGDVW